MTGRTLSHYRIGEEISRGGMGVVYRATDRRLNRDVALKVLPDDLVHDPDRRRRFVQEAQAASALEHPHIAVIHEVDEAEGVTYIAMELIRGDKLSDAMAREPLTPPRALELAEEIAEGLARAHEKNIVHRDLKPANVMLTEDGHAKIIDFGIAKLIEADPAGAADSQTGQLGVTSPGVVLGTMTYMSPEQARGAKVDHRSDIFSFGVLLHEMLAGRPPFQGRNSIETASAIISEPAPRLGPLGPGVTGDAAAEVQRILDKCLAKEPAHRYQGLKDTVVDLRAARRRLESSTQPVAVAPPQKRVPAWLVGGLAAAVLLGAGAWWVFRPQTATPAAAGGDGADRPSLAVLYFDNNTGNPQLDWMRTGITDMLVTDLSQSPDVEVLGTDRLHQILSEMKRADDRTISSEVVQEIAQRAGVKTVLVGSYVKAGDAIRIQVRLQEAATGRIVTSERVEGPNESSLFTMVDDLTRRVKDKLEVLRGGASAARSLLSAPGAPLEEKGLDRGLNEVTTSSIEAYRYYAEGITLHERFREAEAIPLLERAVAIDPGFAMAYAKLAVIHSNLGHIAEREKYGKLALDHSERLTPRERSYIQGFYNSLRPETVPAAIDAYKKGLELFPEHQASRNNLAFLYAALERNAEAVAEYETLIRRGTLNPITYGNLTGLHVRMGQIAKAREIAENATRLLPENALARGLLGWVAIAQGKLDEALSHFDKEDLLTPGTSDPLNGRTVVLLLREDWAGVDETARKLRSGTDPSWRWTAAVNSCIAELYRGRSKDALAVLDKAVRAFPEAGVRSAQARNVKANVHLARSEFAQALAEAQAARAEAAGRGPEFGALALVAEAQLRLKREADAAATLDSAKSLVDKTPGNTGRQRALHRLLGRAALIRGDAPKALEELNTALSTLSPRGSASGPTDHVALWYALGSAHLAQGNAAEAERWFQTIADSTFEHTFAPVEYVRSFYHLGQLREKRGDTDQARAAYRRFLSFWKDGDLDRDLTREAQQKVSGS